MQGHINSLGAIFRTNGS